MPEGDPIGSLLLTFFLIFINAFFAMSEIAIIAFNDVKLRHLAEQGDKRAKILCELTAEESRFLSTIQVGITLAGMFSSAVAAETFTEYVVYWLRDVPISESTLSGIALVVITVLLSFVTLVFGELVPKRIAMNNPERMSFIAAYPLKFVSVVAGPFVKLLSFTTNGILRLMGIDPNETEDQVSEEEIRMMVDAGSEKGAIDEQEKEFIENVFEFDDLTAEEIATHRTDVTILWKEDSIEQWDETIHESRHTLYPVCEDSPDNVVGVLNAKDYFRLRDKSRENVMELVKPAFFVPETIKADVLFRKMKKTHNNLAVVLDEYGGMEGIITLNDLIERLVGDLGEDTPEEEAAEPHIEQLNENTWAIIGNVDLYDIEQALDVDIGLEEVDTFTGLVFNELDMVPGDGDQNIELDFKGLHIRITRVEDHQIVYAEVTKLEAAEEEKTDEE